MENKYLGFPEGFDPKECPYCHSTNFERRTHSWDIASVIISDDGNVWFDTFDTIYDDCEVHPWQCAECGEVIDEEATYKAGRIMLKNDEYNIYPIDTSNTSDVISNLNIDKQQLVNII